MKKLSLACLASILVSIFCITETRAYAEDAKIAVPVSLSYNSTYWWRGIQFEGKGVGVIWPGIGLNYGNLALLATTGVSQDYFGGPDKDTRKIAESFTEVDLGGTYTLSFEKVSIAFGVTYVGYPLYDAYDKSLIQGNFIEPSVTVTANTFLSPFIGVFYDYYFNKYGDNPQNEDYYVKVGVSQNVISTEDGFTCAIGAYVGYYNNAYLDRKGFSDAVLSATLTKNYKNISFVSSLNYGRTLGKDFKAVEAAQGAGPDHFWSTIGATVTL